MTMHRFLPILRHVAAAVLALGALSAHAATEVNQASRAELESVKGIGPGLSGKILEARKSGAFKSWDDFVERVGGVGPGNAARLSLAGLTVGGNSFEGQRVALAPEKKKPTQAVKGDKAEGAGKAEKAGAHGKAAP